MNDIRSRRGTADEPGKISVLYAIYRWDAACFLRGEYDFKFCDKTYMRYDDHPGWAVEIR